MATGTCVRESRRSHWRILSSDNRDCVTSTPFCFFFYFFEITQLGRQATKIKKKSCFSTAFRMWFFFSPFCVFFSSLIRAGAIYSRTLKTKCHCTGTPLLKRPNFADKRVSACVLFSIYIFCPLFPRRKSGGSRGEARQRETVGAGRKEEGKAAGCGVGAGVYGPSPAGSATAVEQSCSRRGNY